MGHSEWVHWTLAGDLESFYADLRWPGWEDESAALAPDHGLRDRPAAVHARGPADRRRGAHARRRWPTLWDRQHAFIARVHRPVMRRRLPLALFFVGAGIIHFVKPGAYEPTVPDALPGHREIVYISGRRGDRGRARRPARPLGAAGPAGG